MRDHRAVVQEREHHRADEVQHVVRDPPAVGQPLTRDAAVPIRKDHDLVTEHHRIRPRIGEGVGLAELLQHLGEPTHRRLWTLEEERHVTLRLVEVLRAVLSREPKVGDPSKRRGNLDGHLAKISALGAGTHAGTGLFHVLLTHGRLPKVSYQRSSKAQFIDAADGDPHPRPDAAPPGSLLHPVARGYGADVIKGEEPGAGHYMPWT